RQPLVQLLVELLVAHLLDDVGVARLVDREHLAAARALDLLRAHECLPLGVTPPQAKRPHRHPPNARPLRSSQALAMSPVRGRAFLNWSPIYSGVRVFRGRGAPRRMPMTRSRKPARLALLLSAVLAFTALATPAAAEPVPTECSDEANFEVQAPSVFGFVGVPLAPAPLTTSSAAPVAWSTECMELPEGVTFDQASASFAGAPASEGEGGGMIVATSESGRGVERVTLRIGPASALQVTMTDA